MKISPSHTRLRHSHINRAFRNIDSLRAIYIGQEPPRNAANRSEAKQQKSKNIAAYHHYIVLARIDGINYEVKFTVKDLLHPPAIRLYSLESIEKESTSAGQSADESIKRQTGTAPLTEAQDQNNPEGENVKDEVSHILHWIESGKAISFQKEKSLTFLQDSAPDVWEKPAEKLNSYAKEITNPSIRQGESENKFSAAQQQAETKSVNRAESTTWLKAVARDQSHSYETRKLAASLAVKMSDPKMKGLEVRTSHGVPENGRGASVTMEETENGMVAHITFDPNAVSANTAAQDFLRELYHAASMYEIAEGATPEQQAAHREKYQRAFEQLRAAMVNDSTYIKKRLLYKTEAASWYRKIRVLT